MGKEGCLLTSCFRSRVEGDCFYDTSYHVRIFAGQHHESGMLMTYKAIWRFISVVISYDLIIRFLLIKDMIPSPLF